MCCRGGGQIELFFPVLSWWGLRACRLRLCTGTRMSREFHVQDEPIESYFSLLHLVFGLCKSVVFAFVDCVLYYMLCRLMPRSHRAVFTLWRCPQHVSPRSRHYGTMVASPNTLYTRQRDGFMPTKGLMVDWVYMIGLGLGLIIFVSYRVTLNQVSSNCQTPVGVLGPVKSFLGCRASALARAMQQESKLLSFCIPALWVDRHWTRCVAPNKYVWFPRRFTCPSVSELSLKLSRYHDSYILFALHGKSTGITGSPAIGYDTSD